MQSFVLEQHLGVVPAPRRMQEANTATAAATAVACNQDEDRAHHIHEPP